jgi:hypothetical protein
MVGEEGGVAAVKYSELKLQSELIASAKHEGGWAQKIGSQFNAQAGVPDLYISLPYFVPCLAEVKWLGKVTLKTNVKPKVTPIQRAFLEKVDSTRHRMTEGFRCIIIVGYEKDGHLYAVALPPTQTTVTVAHLDGTRHEGKRVRQMYPIAEMFEAVSVGRVECHR